MNLSNAMRHPIRSARSYLDWRLDVRSLRKLYSKIIKRGDLVFDIGANKGAYTKIMLSLGAKVIAFEPDPDLVSYLKRRFSPNKNLEVCGKGVGLREGKLKFNIATTNGHSSFKELKGYTELKKEITVDVITLRKCMDVWGVPKFIKIDTEGFEYEVLKTLNVPVDYISFEFTKGSIKETEKCLKIIDGMGNYEYNYAAEGHYGLSNKLVLKDWLSSREIIKMITERNISGDIYARNKN